VFTGRIREVGAVHHIGESRIEIKSPKVAAVLRIGEEKFAATLSVETRHRSTLGELVSGAPVNVEPALCIGDPLDGHVVQGHVDAVGKTPRVDDEGIGRRVWVRANDRALADLLPKGSVAIDGVSLTVAEVLRDRFSVALVPTTLAGTTLSGEP
jgi:3,4-dihydroxy 2-butanone 4-phosphate synthase/3,4-dihydroxy 2-butanone 4-phosphate synthase/GTP cyclohydrolase II